MGRSWSRNLARVALGATALLGAGAAAGSLWSPAGAAPLPADLGYTPVTPCVVFDSRPAPPTNATGVHAGPLNGGQAVTYQVTGSFPAGQGGGNTTCGIPAGAAAVEINVVAVNALNEGNLRVTDGNPSATGGVVNYNNLAPKLNTSNAVIVPLDAGGQLTVTPNCGTTCTADTTDVRGVVLGYFTDGLTQRVAALEALLKDVTRVPASLGNTLGETLRFSGLNVQVVDGTGETGCNSGAIALWDDACNGTGNLIVGYAEPTEFPDRIGSHNLIVGPGHSWTSYGGVVFGDHNGSFAPHASVTGGFANVAIGPQSSVTGGVDNRAEGGGAMVAGGHGNEAEGVWSTVTGGDSNTTEGTTSVVSGGYANTAAALNATVSGGSTNRAENDAASVSGGRLNVASGVAASVSGGQENLAAGEQAAVSGGYNNDATALNATVSGGSTNLAGADSATVTGGQGNTASGIASSVSGGNMRTASGLHDWVGGALFQGQ